MWRRGVLSGPLRSSAARAEQAPRPVTDVMLFRPRSTSTAARSPRSAARPASALLDARSHVRLPGRARAGGVADWIGIWGCCVREGGEQAKTVDGLGETRPRDRARQRDRQAGKQTDRKTDRQTDRQTDRAAR